MKHSEETKKKIGDSLRKSVVFNCDMCGKVCLDKPSSFDRKKRHFCSMKCYAKYRKDILPIEEQPSYKGGGIPIDEKKIRIKSRSILNHAIREGKIIRKPCTICGNIAEAHHPDYNRPLDVIWLCFRHHREIHEKPELLNGD